MVDGISQSTRANLIAVLQTQAQMDQTQLRLASGKAVNSALDDTNAFFASFDLNNQAKDLNLLLDNVGQSIQTIKLADQSLAALEKTLEQMEALAHEAIGTQSFAPSDPLNTQILEDNPFAYWRLNETGGPTAVNSGSAGNSLDATYQSGVTRGTPAIYDNGGDLVPTFDGVDDRIRIPNSNLINTAVHDERTIELVFKADSTQSRQLLFEEGGGINSMSIYIEDNKVWVNGKDNGDWGPFEINAPIRAGEVYHVALVLDQPNGELRGYLDGELMGTGAVTIPLSTHSGGIALGRIHGSTGFHDGTQTGSSAAFSGQIADVAMYNRVLSQNDLKSHADAVDPGNGLQLARDFEALKTQIDELIQDSSYRGVNLLRNGSMQTVFNDNRTSTLKTQGDDFSTLGLNLTDATFEGEVETEFTLASLKAAKDQVRNFRASLASDQNVISSRETQIKEMINVFIEGSDKLVLADLNQESAKLQALETSQQLSLAALQISTQAQRAVLSLF